MLAILAVSLSPAQANDWWDAMSFSIQRRNEVQESWKQHQEKATRERIESQNALSSAQQKRLSVSTLQPEVPLNSALQAPTLELEKYLIQSPGVSTGFTGREEYFSQRNDARGQRDLTQQKRLMMMEKNADQRAVGILADEFIKP